MASGSPNRSSQNKKEEAVRKARARAAARARASQAIRQAKATARRTKGVYKPRSSSFVARNRKPPPARASFLSQVLRPVTVQFKRARSAATRVLRRSEPRAAAARARSTRIRKSSLNVGKLSRISREIEKLQRNKNAATGEANKRKIQNKINRLRSQRSNVMAMYG